MANSYDLLWGLIQVSIACAIGLCIAMAFRGRSPQSISSLLAGTIVGAFLLTLVSLFPGAHWSVALPSSGPSSNAIDRIQSLQVSSFADASSPRIQSLDDAQPIEPVAAIEANHAWARAVRIWIGSKLNWIDSGIPGVNATPIEARRSTQPFLYAIGALLGIGGLLWSLSLGWMWRVLRRSVPIDTPEMHQMLDSFRKQLGIRSPIAIHASPDIGVGATVGIRRGVILLNQSWESWTQPERQSVLAHEAAHIARGDFGMGLLGSVFRVLYFFHPLAHLVVRRLRIEQELAADQLAAGLIGNAREYGRALAGLAIRTHDQRWTTSPVVMADSMNFIWRMTMIKHGRLKPLTKRGRWYGAIAIAAAIAVLPLTGLRGTPPDDKTESKVVEPQSTDSSALSVSKEQFLLDRKIRTTFPPLQFEGKLTYLPGRFDPDRASPVACWLNAFATMVVFGAQPSHDALLSGKASFDLQWTDLDRQHGSQSMRMDLLHASHFPPGSLTKLFSDPTLAGVGPLYVPVCEDRVEGHRIIGVGTPTYDPDLGKRVDPVVPDAWVLDCDHGYLRGTQAEIAEFIRNLATETDDAIPAPDAPLLHIDFVDCQDWHAQLSKFIEGSPREQDFAPLQSFLKGLNGLRLSVNTYREGALEIEGTFDNESDAASVRGLCTALIAMGVAQLDSDPALVPMREPLQSVAIEQQGSTLKLVVPELLAAMTMGYTQSGEGPDIGPIGWEADCCPGLSKCHEGALLATGKNYLYGLPACLVQNIDATAYRGKQVRVEIEADPSDADIANVGAFLWASGDRMKSVGFQSQAFDKEHDFANRESGPSLNDSKPTSHWSPEWRTLSIVMDVPADATVLSYGTYAARLKRDLRIRSIQIDAIGQATGQPIGKGPASVNLFVPSQRVVHRSPRNGNLAEWNVHPDRGNDHDEPATVARGTESTTTR